MEWGCLVGRGRVQVAEPGRGADGQCETNGRSVGQSVDDSKVVWYGISSTGGQDQDASQEIRGSRSRRQIGVSQCRAVQY